MSPSKENYLKTIYEISLDFQKVTNKQIANILNVSAASVTEMLTTLVNDDLVEHKPYTHQVRLTESGQETASQMIRRHRIWEVFLYEKLNYPIYDLHNSADSLEHASDDKLIDSLNEFLGYPTRCPHGGIIPHNVEKIDLDDQPLTELKSGTTGKINRVIDNSKFLNYFQNLGLKIGDEITIVQNDDDKIVVNNKDSDIEIDPNYASFIFIK